MEIERNSFTRWVPTDRGIEALLDNHKKYKATHQRIESDKNFGLSTNRSPNTHSVDEIQEIAYILSINPEFNKKIKSLKLFKEINGKRKEFENCRYAEIIYQGIRSLSDIERIMLIISYINESERTDEMKELLHSHKRLTGSEMDEKLHDCIYNAIKNNEELEMVMKEVEKLPYKKKPRIKKH